MFNKLLGWGSSSRDRVGDLSENGDHTVQELPTSETKQPVHPPLPTSQTVSRALEITSGESSLPRSSNTTPALESAKESTPGQQSAGYQDSSSQIHESFPTGPDSDAAKSGNTTPDQRGESSDALHTLRPRHAVLGEASAIADAGAVQAWRQLRAIRANVINKRVDKTQQIETLRRHRQFLRAQELLLLDRFTQALGGDSSPLAAQLREQVERLEHERREQTSLEEACEKIEDEIIDEEWRMRRLEDRFYTTSEEDVAPFAEFGNALKYRSGSEEAEDTDSTISLSLIRADPSPTAKLYLSLLGDRDLLRERLGGLRSERASLEAERSMRAMHGLSLDEDSLQTLAEFDKTHDELMSGLTQVEADLEVLRGQLSNGDMQPLSPLSAGSFPDPKRNAGRDSTYDQPLSAQEQEMFRPLTEDITGPFFDNARETSDMSKFINDWLLYNLRLLDREKQIYLRVSGRQTSTLPTRMLGQQIMDNWFDDDTVDSFIHAKRLGSWSHGRSVKATLDETQRKTAQSDAPVSRRRRNLPLLQTSANTRAISIIARAREEQASSGVTVI